ncbi:MAG TPA: thymidine kinase [Acidobacteriota bacterium]|nr:thymidine kinase [Acidobacteriota bacterium]
MKPLILNSTGWVEVICGSMFSGKSEELIRRLRRAQIARQRVQVFKPKIDDRYSGEHIVSHSELRIRSQQVSNSQEILETIYDRCEVIGIDEAQFFDAGIVQVCERLANMGKRVIVAGLDKDYRNRPFDPMPELLAIAEYITKTLAICMRCGNPAANCTQRLVESGERILVGADDAYEARCRRCYEPPDEAPARSERATPKAQETNSQPIREHSEKTSPRPVKVAAKA